MCTEKKVAEDPEISEEEKKEEGFQDDGRFREVYVLSRRARGYVVWAGCFDDVCLRLQSFAFIKDGTFY